MAADEEEKRRRMEKACLDITKVRGEISNNFASYQGLVKKKLEETTREVLRPIELQESMEVVLDTDRTIATDEEIKKMEETVADLKKLKAAVSELLKPLANLQPKDLPTPSETMVGADGKPSDDRTEQDKKVEQILEHDAEKKMEEQYERLPPDLQMCLLCFSIFPVDKMIEKKVLIYWWIGEGFAAETKEKSAEQVGEEYFQQLIDLGFVLPVYNKRRGSILKCKMHPRIRWLIIKRARDEGLFSLDETGTPSLETSKLGRACLFTKDKQGLLPKSSNESTPTPTRTSSKRSPPPKETQSLKSLFNVNVKCVKLDKFSLHKFDDLVVLQLGKWVGAHNDHYGVAEKDPEKNDILGQHIEMEEPEILDKLEGVVKLRYLSLRGMSRITRLPKWIGACRLLQILDLKGCQNLSELTEDIKSLGRLTHLDVAECYMLDRMPKALSNLSQLVVLKGFVFGGSPSSSHAYKISDLAKLTKLRKLSISISNLEQTGDDLKNLKYIKSLENLSITWSGKELAPALPPNLVKLDLRCFPGVQLGAWLEPKNQEKLEKLYIRGGGNLQKLGLEDYGFIKKLRLKYLKSLEMKEFDVEYLRQQLDYLEIYECPKITVRYPFDLDGVWVNDDPTQTPAPPEAQTLSPPEAQTPTIPSISPPPPPPPTQTPAPSISPPATQTPAPPEAQTPTIPSISPPPPPTQTPAPSISPPPAPQTPSAPSISPPPTAQTPSAPSISPLPAAQTPSAPSISPPPTAQTLAASTSPPPPTQTPSAPSISPPPPTQTPSEPSISPPPAARTPSVPSISPPPAAKTPSAPSISPPPTAQTPAASISPPPATQATSAPSISPPPATQTNSAPSISPPATANS